MNLHSWNANNAYVVDNKGTLLAGFLVSDA